MNIHNSKTILDFVKKQRIVTSSEVAEFLKMSWNTADKYLSVMKWSGISEMFVPQMGLADGIIHVLYSKHKQKFV